MGQLGGRRAGLASAFRSYLVEFFPPWDLQRPTMLGEWGGHWNERDPEKLAAELRVGLWLQTVLPYGGNTGFWWWLWVDAADRWHDYEAIARFNANEDPRGKNYKPYRARVEDGDAKVYCYGMRSKDSHRYYAWLAGLGRKLRNGAVDERAGVALIETAHANATWRIRRYNGESGEIESDTTLTADNKGLIRLDLGSLTPDAVYKLDVQP